MKFAELEANFAEAEHVEDEFAQEMTTTLQTVLDANTDTKPSELAPGTHPKIGLHRCCADGVVAQDVDLGATGRQERLDAADDADHHRDEEENKNEDLAGSEACLGSDGKQREASLA